MDLDATFFYGLTAWMSTVSVQVRESEVIIHDMVRSTDVALDLAEARRLRDLLNVATARGFM